MINHLQGFPALYAVPLVALSLLNYLLRFWRWEIYRKSLCIALPARESLALFLATFAMVITPGKIGEIYKAAYLWERRRVPLSTGLPIILAERFLDFSAVLILAGAGLVFWRGPLAGMGSTLLMGCLLTAAFLLLRSSALRRALVDRLASRGVLRRYRPDFSGALEGLGRLLSGRLLAAPLLLSFAAWFAECGSLWLVCNGLQTPVLLTDAIFIYAAATLAGSLFFLPGGLGGTEAALILLLAGTGVPHDAAVAAALIVRLATLWLAVAIGLTTFGAGRRRFLVAAAPEP